jgi:hypothetical protein
VTLIAPPQTPVKRVLAVYAGSGSDAIYRVSNILRFQSPDPNVYLKKLMFDLSSVLPSMQEKFRELIVGFHAKNGARAQTVFVHTHPNYGQVHIYCTTKENADPYEDLVGYFPIELIFHNDALEEASRDESGFRMLDGTTVVPWNNEECNVIFAQHCSVCLAAQHPSQPL